MKATVVVSCYKQDRYIEECLDSILSQETSFEFDVLVSDDASPDSTQEILISYAHKFPDKIKLILRQENVGAARNYIDAHNSAEGEVVFHFDGDDVMLPGKLQKQYDLFLNNPDVDLVFHRACYFSDDGAYVTESGSPYNMAGEVLLFNLADIALWGSITVHSAYAYRRSSRRTRAMEREFMEWYFAMDSLLSGGTGAYIDEVLVRYRCNPHGNAYLSSRPGRVKAYDINFQDLEFYFKEIPYARRQIYANYLFTCLARLKAGCGVSLRSVRFLLLNAYNFRAGLLVQTFRMRKSVAPLLRVR